MYEVKPIPTRGSAVSQLPDPTGFRILLALPEIKEKSDGGIILDPGYTAKEAQASVLGFVLKMGPDCYVDKTKFPTGPWCKVGDWVLIRSYAGSRVKIFDKEFRIINDDTIECVVHDPQGIKRAI